MSENRYDHAIELIDQAIGDWTVGPDAMRVAPDLEVEGLDQSVDWTRDFFERVIAPEVRRLEAAIDTALARGVANADDARRFGDQAPDLRGVSVIFDGTAFVRDVVDP